MEMGSPNLASNMADEWLFETAGIAGFFVITGNKNHIIIIFIIEALFILTAAFVIIRRTKS